MKRWQKVLATVAGFFIFIFLVGFVLCTYVY